MLIQKRTDSIRDADRPQPTVWAFIFSLASVNLVIWPSVET
jgi:hypothetical protein